MSFEADYRTAILTYAPLTALVADRVDIRLAQPPVFPGIRFQRVATSRLYAQTGRVRLCEARVQHDCWSPDSIQAATLMDLLIRALDTFTLAGGTGRPNFVINQWLTDEPEPEPVVWRGVVEAKIYFLDSA